MTTKARCTRCKCGKRKPPLWQKCQECKDALSAIHRSAWLHRKEAEETRELSKDEIDIMIAEQRKCLPEWWDKCGE